MKKIMHYKWILLMVLIITGGLLYQYSYKPYKIENDFKKYLDSFMIAVNQRDCSNLYPLNQLNGIDKNVICPREDVGNFMVIDKVSYGIKNVLGDQASHNRQVLMSVCMDVRGNAAWNEDKYSDCKTDPLVINFSLKNSKWEPNIKDFTNLSDLIRTAGAKSGSYNCIGMTCFPKSNGTIEYAIKMHKFPQQGVAH